MIPFLPQPIFNNFFENDLLKSAADLGVNTNHLAIAEMLFELGMPNFADIKRYRVREALQNLLVVKGVKKELQEYYNSFKSVYSVVRSRQL